MNELRKAPAERVAVCRLCDKAIKIGETKVSFYSPRNCGMHIHLCIECCKKIGDAVYD